MLLRLYFARGMAVNCRFCGLFARLKIMMKPREMTWLRARFYALESGLQRGCFLPDFGNRRTMDGQTDGQQTDIVCVEKVGLRGVFVPKVSRNSAKSKK